MHGIVIRKFREGDLNYLKNTLSYHKVVHCLTCVNRRTVNEWINHAISEKIWETTNNDEENE